MKRALVLSLICVVGLAFAGFGQALTGSWITTVCLNPQTDSFAGAITLTSTLGVTYAIGDWAFTTTTKLNGDGWADQDFGVTGLFGLITVDSALGFTVPVGGFDKWVTTVGLNMAGVSFSGKFTLIAGAVDLDLTMTAGIGSAVEGSIVLGLGGGVGCDFDFQDIKIGLDFLFCDCALIESEIAFDCELGFKYIKFEAKGIAIPNLPWVTLNAKLYFELQTKEITISPVFDFGAIVCFDVYFDVVDGAGVVAPDDSLSLESISIAGIGISCDIGGVTFAAISYWGDTLKDYIDYPGENLPGALALHPDYWEAYSIDVGADACCGGVFEFGLDFFFKDTHTGETLFEVSLIEADMKVNVTTQFAFTMGLDVDVEGGFTKWCLGFEVIW